MKKIYLFLLFNVAISLALNAQIKYVTESGGSQGNDGTTWDTAYDKSRLQQAINEAETSGDQVWVAKGTYIPTETLVGTADIDKSFILRNGVKIYGGFVGTETSINARTFPDINPNETILSGDFGGGVNARHVVVNITNISGVLLDGFTISGGKAAGTGSSGSVLRSSGGGLSITTNAGISFANLIIENNSSTGIGAGVYISVNATVQGEKAIFSNVKFINNSGTRGGALYAIADAASTASLEITNGSFVGNTGTLGGAMYIYRIPATISRTIFESTTATGNGGVINIEYGTHKVNFSNFIGNTSSADGVVYIFRGVLNLSNSIFYNNSNRSSIIHSGSSSAKGTLTAVNNTFYKNKFTDVDNAPVDVGVGVITFRNTSFGEANIYNNIFRDNTDNANNLYDISKIQPSSGTILRLRFNLFETDYSLINTNVTVNNNKVYNASLSLFGTNISNPSAANFLDIVEGQATQAGDNTLATNAGLLPGTDLSGNNRETYGIIDLGAYEYQGVLPVQFDYFKATKSGNTASLTWRTISETDNSHFIIERGSSLTNFKELTQKAGAGTIVSASLYSFVDQNPLNGTNYYRLTQYDKNGTSKVLGEQALNFSINGLQNSVYPNPAAQKVFVKLADAKGAVTVDLVSLTGQTILAKAYNISGNEEIAIDLTEVPRGSYILWLNKGKNNNDKKKLLVVK